MAWDEWTESGRVDSYRFEVLPLTSITAKPKADITQFVTDCSLNFDWEADTRAGGQFSFDGCEPIDNCYVRIYFTPTISGTRREVELGTFYAFTQDARFEDGRWTGTTTLESVLSRYTRDRLYKNWALNANGSAVAAFKAVMKEFGGSYIIDGVKDKKFTKTKVVEFGETVFFLLSTIAKTLGCALNVDTHGRVVLEPIKAASSRALSGSIPIGQRSVTMPGVNYACTWQTTPNRYATHYKWDSHSFYVKNKSGKSIKLYNAVGGKQTGTATGQLFVSQDTSYKGKKWGYVPSRKAWVNVSDDCTKVKDSKSTPQKTVTKHLYGKAVTASSADNHPNRIGRYITETEDLDDLSPVTQAQIDKVTKNGLKAATQITAPTFKFSCLYLPLELNRVYWFRQGDVRIDGLVTSIDMELAEDLLMSVSVRKVRSHG